MKRTWTLILDTDRSEIIDQVKKSLNLLALRVAAPNTELQVSIPETPKTTKEDMERFEKWRKNTTPSSSAKKTPVKKTKRSNRKKVS